MLAQIGAREDNLPFNLPFNQGGGASSDQVTWNPKLDVGKAAIKFTTLIRLEPEIYQDNTSGPPGNREQHS